MGQELLGNFEQQLLAALLHLRDNAYGVTIAQAIEERIGKDVSLGAIYTGLDRLEKKGFVSSRLGEATAERGGRPKRYFQIKGAGVKALNESRAAMDRMFDGLAAGA